MFGFLYLLLGVIIGMLLSLGIEIPVVSIFDRNIALFSGILLFVVGAYASLAQKERDLLN